MFGLRYPGSPMLVDPPANQSVRAGTPATLTARRQGGVELFYQWYGGEKGDTSHPLVDATNATYTTEPLTVNTSYWMKVYYSLGTTNILRLGAQVTVYPADGVSLEIKLSSGNPAVLINGVIDHRYRVESSSDVTARDWTNLGEFTLTANPFTFLDSTPATEPKRFYRVVALDQ